MTFKPKSSINPIFFKHDFSKESIRHRKGLLELYQNQIESSEHTILISLEEEHPDYETLEHVGNVARQLKADMPHFRAVLYVDMIVSKLMFWKNLRRRPRMRRRRTTSPLLSYT
jgi:hypothetical protein